MQAVAVGYEKGRILTAPSPPPSLHGLFRSTSSSSPTRSHSTESMVCWSS